MSPSIVRVSTRRTCFVSLVSPNRRSPVPSTTGKTFNRSSSTRSCSSNVRAIRALPGDKKDVLTIALTGAVSWDLADPFAAASAGFDYHLLKPVMPSTLVQLLVALLRERPKRGSGKHPRIDADIPRAASTRRQQR